MRRARMGKHTDGSFIFESLVFGWFYINSCLPRFQGMSHRQRDEANEDFVDRWEEFGVEVPPYFGPSKVLPENYLCNLACLEWACI